MTVKNEKKSRKKKPHTATTAAKTKGEVVNGAGVEATSETEATSEATTSTTEQHVAPVVTAKKALTTEQTLDIGLMKVVKDELRDREREKQLEGQLEKLKALIVSLGLEVPPDEEEEESTPANGKAKAVVAGKGGKRNLWEVIEEYMASKHYIEPKFGEASEIVSVTTKMGYATAANTLSQKAKSKELVKQGRGLYALPKGWKPKK